MCEIQFFLSSRQMSLDCLIFLHLLKSALFSHLPQFHLALASPCLLPFPSFLISSLPSLISLPLPSLLTSFLFRAKPNSSFYSFQHLIIFGDLGFWYLCLQKVPSSPSKFSYAKAVLRVPCLLPSLDNHPRCYLLPLPNPQSMASVSLA